MDINQIEFFRALYWHYEGRDIRLTTFQERDLPDATLVPLAFQRARSMELSPLFNRISWGQFLRHGNDHEIGIAWPRVQENPLTFLSET